MAKTYYLRPWLWVDSADDKLVIFFFSFFLDNCCMKCQILFSRKNKKHISKCCLLKFLPGMQSVKWDLSVFFPRQNTVFALTFLTPYRCMSSRVDYCRPKWILRYCCQQHYCNTITIAGSYCSSIAITIRNIICFKKPKDVHKALVIMTSSFSNSIWKPHCWCNIWWTQHILTPNLKCYIF